MREYRFYEVIDLDPGQTQRFAHRVASAVHVAVSELRDDPGRVCANDDVITNPRIRNRDDDSSPRFIEVLGEQPVDFNPFEEALREACDERRLTFKLFAEAVLDWATRSWMTSRKLRHWDGRNLELSHDYHRPRPANRSGARSTRSGPSAIVARHMIDGALDEAHFWPNFAGVADDIVEHDDDAGYAHRRIDKMLAAAGLGDCWRLRGQYSPSAKMNVYRVAALPMPIASA